ncbi:MAG: aminotransferase class III-fold pyridoxal phosphate-dependent enzyme [Gammaproteobacteria bacterium]|nr:aminotransferase class III-fold pyridoxal phosphate-dependent enzyme [Gammaproteobacteria bacterium]
MTPEPTSNIRFLAPIPPQFSQHQAEQAASELFGLEGTFKQLNSERDQNFRIQTDNGDYVFKISNAKEDPTAIDFQTQSLLHIARSDPSLPIPQVILTRDNHPQAFMTSADGTQHLVRVLSYLPGTILTEVPRNRALFKNVGAVIAQSGVALRGFFHAAAGYDLLWDLRHLVKLRPLTIYIEDTALRQAIERDLDYTLEHIFPRLAGLRSQIIHNDGNTHNIIVSPDNPTKVAGLVDFGDMMHAPLIFDLAVSAGSMTLDSDDPVETLCDVAAGYDSVCALENDEVNLLSHLAVGRITQELLIAAKRQADDPDAPAYVVDDQAAYRKALDQLLSLGHQHIRGRLRDACQFPTDCPTGVAVPGAKEDDIKPLLKRRQASLGKTLELAYDQPFHVVRGEGVWLYDADGRRHLDVYNNVPHVGHCHPHVVKAVSRQLATLNTNTRYLFDNVVSYAERLTATMPDGLDSCIFVNSGSEANDAAMRISRTLTGNQGAIILEDAYHGITESIDELSPAAYPGPEAPEIAARVRTLEAPNMYRGRFADNPENAARLYAESADSAIQSLAESGHGTAAFMVDSSFSSNGILSVLPGYLPAVAEKVRAAGGLIIADEVQIGFGRSGSHLWGFEAQDIIPDIVTLGKPVANGIALGVVVTTTDIREQFGTQIDFFSTFGGNPVACAAAHAVLDVVEQEGLRENAKDTGDYIRAELSRLAEQCPVIGDVRGQGLFCGVEIVRDKASKEPAADIADTIRNRLRENRVLVGREGRAGNIIKVRPPLAFRREHAEQLIKTFADVLKTLE